MILKGTHLFYYSLLCYMLLFYAFSGLPSTLLSLDKWSFIVADIQQLIIVRTNWAVTSDTTMSKTDSSSSSKMNTGPLTFGALRNFCWRAPWCAGEDINQSLHSHILEIIRNPKVHYVSYLMRKRLSIVGLNFCNRKIPKFYRSVLLSIISHLFSHLPHHPHICILYIKRYTISFTNEKKKAKLWTKGWF